MISTATISILNNEIQIRYRTIMITQFSNVLSKLLDSQERIENSPQSSFGPSLLRRIVYHMSIM